MVKQIASAEEFAAIKAAGKPVRASTRDRARIDVERDAIALGTVSECGRAIDARDATFVQRRARARV